MMENLFVNGLRRWLVSICFGWLVFAFLGLVSPMDVQAQSSDSGTPVLRFKIPSPPQQAASTSTTTTTLPTETMRPSTNTAPVIEEKPSEVAAEKQASQPPVAKNPSPSTAPLSHELQPPNPSAIPRQPAEASSQPSAPQEQPSPKKPGPALPAAEKPGKKAASVETQNHEKLISSISVQKDDPAGEILNVMLNGFYPPQVSSAEGGPPRIICDFPDVRLGQGVPKVIPVNGRFITQVRIGLHNQPAMKVRIVLDLVPDYNYDVEQFYYQKENQYSLIVKKRS